MLTLHILNRQGKPIAFRAHYVVCHRCMGNGKIENPAFSNGFSQSEFAESFDDEDARERYFSGAYDVLCTECAGDRVTLQRDDTDDDKLTDEQRNALAYQEDELQAEREHQLESRLELLMGA